MILFRKVLSKLIYYGFFNYLSDEKYLKLIYWARTGLKLDFNNVKTYDEKLQYLKLYDRKPEYTNLVDKIEVKKIVGEKIGSDYIIKTIGVYDKFNQINFEELPNSFVIKCSHDSGGLVVCKNKNDLDLKKVKKKINKCLKHNYYKRSREWQYNKIRPRILIEEYIELGDINNHFDYKFMCFNGEVKYLFLDVGVIDSEGGHAEEYYRNIYDKDFNLQDFKETRNNTPFIINKPKNFEKMIEIAETLSKNIPHVRIDLYNVNGKIYFGEITFYHGSGINNFIPNNYSIILGDLIDLNLLKNSK